MRMKRERIVYGCWLAVLLALIAGYSLGFLKLWNLGATRAVGLIVFVMTDLLYVLLMIFGTERRRTKKTLRQLLSFLVMTAVYIYYCFYLAGILRANGYENAVVAGTFFCIAVVFGGGYGKEKSN